VHRYQVLKGMVFIISFVTETDGESTHSYLLLGVTCVHCMKFPRRQVAQIHAIVYCAEGNGILSSLWLTSKKGTPLGKSQPMQKSIPFIRGRQLLQTSVAVRKFLHHLVGIIIDIMIVEDLGIHHDFPSVHWKIRIIE